MATVTLRVDDLIRDQLQAMAEGRGMSVSDLIRSAIDALFDRPDRDEPRRGIVPESISAVDRKQLSLLHQILARLVDRVDDDRLGEEGDTRYQLDRAQALERGWTSEYDIEFYAVEPELTRRECGLVMDILDMFRVLKFSIEAIEAIEGGLPEDQIRCLTFRGFDLNDGLESRLLAYARWLVKDGRWQEQAAVFAPENDRGNSHMPCLGLYVRLLEAYEPIRRTALGRRSGRERYLLTAEDLAEVATAAYPGRWAE